MQFSQFVALPFLALAAVASAADVPGSYPYVKPSEVASGIQIGPGAGIALPAWLLMLIFIGFVGLAGMLVVKLMNIPKERGTLAPCWRPVVCLCVGVCVWGGCASHNTNTPSCVRLIPWTSCLLMSLFLHRTCRREEAPGQAGEAAEEEVCQGPVICGAERAPPNREPSQRQSSHSFPLYP